MRIVPSTLLSTLGPNLPWGLIYLGPEVYKQDLLWAVGAPTSAPQRHRYKPGPNDQGQSMLADGEAQRIQAQIKGHTRRVVSLQVVSLPCSYHTTPIGSRGLTIVPKGSHIEVTHLNMALNKGSRIYDP